MRFKFCPECGAPLQLKTMGDDGPTPWCDHCRRPWFDMFPVCVIGLVHDRQGRVLLLEQHYIHPVYRNLVSGYLTPGESAEQAMCREIREETGLDVLQLRSQGTLWFERRGMLMAAFFAEVDSSQPLRLSSEVDGAQWVRADLAPALVHPFATSPSRILTLAYTASQSLGTTTP